MCQRRDMKPLKKCWAFVGFLFALTAPAAVLDDWSTGVFAPSLGFYGGSPPLIQRIAYGNGIFTAIGIRPCSTCDVYDAMLTSVDGIRWLDRTNNYFNSGVTEIAFDAGQFVALEGNYGLVPGFNTRVMRSTNGVDWSGSQPAGYNGWDLNGVAYGNGRWVIAASPASAWERITFFVSTDGGESWTGQNFGGRSVAIAFGNDVFVALVNGRAFYSSDGVTWNYNRVTPTSGASDITFGNGFFVLAKGTSVVVATNFTSGTPIYTIPLPTTNSIQVVKYLTNLFVAFAGRELLTSSNATNWINHGAVVPFAPLDVSYGHGRFVALSGTNYAFSPPLAASVLQPAKPVGALTVSGEPGRQYALQAKDSLSITTWQSVATITLTNPSQSFADPQATNFPQRFYRTQLLP